MAGADKKDFLSSNLTVRELIKTMPEEYFSKLIPVSYKRGDDIVRVGDPVGDVMLFESGMYSFLLPKSDGSFYMHSYNTKLHFCGIAEILCGKSRINVSLRALTDCRGYIMKRDDFLRWLSESDEMKTVLLFNWADLLCEKNYGSIHLTGNTRISLISFLLQQCRTGTKSINGYYNVYVSRKELAEFLDTSKRTVYRLLDDLESAGLISRTKGAIILSETNVSSLEKYLLELTKSL